MVMIDAPEAATWQTVEGWVSRRGVLHLSDLA